MRSYTDAVTLIRKKVVHYLFLALIKSAAGLQYTVNLCIFGSLLVNVSQKFVESLLDLLHMVVVEIREVITVLLAVYIRVAVLHWRSFNDG